MDQKGGQDRPKMRTKTCPKREKIVRKGVKDKLKREAKTDKKLGPRQAQKEGHDRSKKEATTGFNVGPKQTPKVDQDRLKKGAKTY